MNLSTLIIGIIAQVLFAVFQFMAVIFAGGGAANAGGLKPWQITALDLSIFLLPAISVLVSILLIVLYKLESQYLSNWWHALPGLTFVAYVVFVFSLNGK